MQRRPVKRCPACSTAAARVLQSFVHESCSLTKVTLRIPTHDVRSQYDTDGGVPGAASVRAAAVAQPSGAETRLEQRSAAAPAALSGSGALQGLPKLMQWRPLAHTAASALSQEFAAGLTFGQSPQTGNAAKLPPPSPAVTAEARHSAEELSIEDIYVDATAEQIIDI